MALNQNLLTKEVQQFIRENWNTDVLKLVLKQSSFSDVNMQEIAQQIVGLQKIKKKIPTWFSTENLLFPPKLNLEQSSSESTAKFKASLIDGKSLVDVTGGFGVDSWAFSEQLEKVIHLESNPELQPISNHNLKILCDEKVESYLKDSRDFLINSNQKYDWLYADPARRGKGNSKVFRLEDLTPNPLVELELWQSKSDNILLKLSPMLDISVALKSLSNISDVYVVSVKNEVKEILLKLVKNHSNHPKIHAVNLESNQADFEFYLEEEQSAEIEYSEPLQYLYEPNASIIKSGAFKLVGLYFKLKKLEPNTHLYTSNELIQNFSGRVFEFEREITNPKKELKGKSVQIIRRNYPLTSNEIQKKYKCKSDGTEPIIFSTSVKGKFVWKVKRL